MKASAKPGCDASSGTWRAHLSATMQCTPWPRSASSMAGASRSANGSLPQRRDSATQPATAPGVVTLSQPRTGMRPPWRRSKWAGSQAAGATPDALRPCSRSPSHTIANRSLPRPLDTGSTMVSAAAAAMAASIALPPCSSMRRPACEASGCEVETTLRANTGLRTVGYGLRQSKFMVSFSGLRTHLRQHPCGVAWHPGLPTCRPSTAACSATPRRAS